MPSQATHYFALEKLLTPITHLKNILALAQWDKATMLASGSAASRQREIASVTSIAHKMLTAPAVGECVAAASQEEDLLDEWQKANLKVIKKAYEKARCIPAELKEQYSVVTGTCEFVWRKARKNNDFKLLSPHLDQVFGLARQVGALRAKQFGQKPYDTLLDVYNPDFTSQSIKAVYAVLKAELPDLIQAIVDRQASETVIPLTEKIDEATQKALNLKIVEKMGFSLAHGRLDKSAHPFC
ncbi:MAG: carboxypeptidase M32, partial [Bacteroidota bacterium]